MTLSIVHGLFLTMMWGRSNEPCKEKAKRFARWALSEYIEGRERAYMVEAAINDLREAYGSHGAADLAELSLKEERPDLMNLALAKLPPCLY